MGSSAARATSEAPGHGDRDGAATRPVDARFFRDCLAGFATGVTVVTARAANGENVGLTVSSFNSLSLAPPLVLWSLALGGSSEAAFLAARFFAVSVLSVEQSDLALRFSRPDGNRFAGVDTHAGLGGARLIDGAIAWFECETVGSHRYGDHQLFVGEVHRCGRRPGSALLFHDGKLHGRWAPGH